MVRVAKTPRSQCSGVLVREVDPTNATRSLNACSEDLRSCKTRRRQINKQNWHKINTKKENGDHTKSRKEKKQWDVWNYFKIVPRGHPGQGGHWLSVGSNWTASQGSLAGGFSSCSCLMSCLAEISQRMTAVWHICWRSRKIRYTNIRWERFGLASVLWKSPGSLNWMQTSWAVSLVKC